MDTTRSILPFRAHFGCPPGNIHVWLPINTFVCFCFFLTRDWTILVWLPIHWDWYVFFGEVFFFFCRTPITIPYPLLFTENQQVLVFSSCFLVFCFLFFVFFFLFYLVVQVATIFGCPSTCLFLVLVSFQATLGSLPKPRRSLLRTSTCGCPCSASWSLHVHDQPLWKGRKKLQLLGWQIPFYGIDFSPKPMAIAGNKRPRTLVLIN